MANQPHKTRRSTAFDLVVPEALAELRAALIERDEARLELANPNLPTHVRGGVVARHDRATVRIVKARPALDAALRAGREP